MPTPIINIYEPNLNDSLEKRVKDLTNAYIDVMQQIRLDMSGDYKVHQLQRMFYVGEDD